MNKQELIGYVKEKATLYGKEINEAWVDEMHDLKTEARDSIFRAAAVGAFLGLVLGFALAVMLVK